MDTPSRGQQADRLNPRMRDRISVDLRGLKAALAQRAKEIGVSPSDLVRTTLAASLGQRTDSGLKEGGPEAERSATSSWRPAASSALPGAPGGTRVRLCIRMRRDQAQAAQAASSRQRLSLGEYLAGLVAGVPVLTSGASRSDLVAELRSSSAEVATLARNIHRLAAVLRQADVEAAQVYRAMLDKVAGQVHSHLQLAAQALAALQPRSASGATTTDPAACKPQRKPKSGPLPFRRTP